MLYRAVEAECLIFLYIFLVLFFLAAILFHLALVLEDLLGFWDLWLILIGS